MGYNIILPFEHKPNPYLPKYINICYFFVRMFLLIKYSYAFVVLRDDMGTLDECYESTTFIQTKIFHFYFYPKKYALHEQTCRG